MLAICRNFYRVTENYRAITEMNRKLQRITEQSQSITENFTQTFCPYRARTEPVHGVQSPYRARTEPVQSPYRGKFIKNIIKNSVDETSVEKSHLMTATAEFQ